KSERPVAIHRSVNEHFKDLDVDQHKSDINQDVHDAAQWPAHHFALTQGYPGHHLPALSPASTDHHVLSKQNVPADLPDIVSEESDCPHQQNTEYDRANHATDYLAFLPKTEKFTYRFGFSLRSRNKTSRFCADLLRLLYNESFFASL